MPVLHCFKCLFIVQWGVALVFLPINILSLNQPNHLHHYSLLSGMASDQHCRPSAYEEILFCNGITCVVMLIHLNTFTFLMFLNSIEPPVVTFHSHKGILKGNFCLSCPASFLGSLQNGYRRDP
jgi:hypothetical protein